MLNTTIKGTGFTVDKGMINIFDRKIASKLDAFYYQNGSYYAIPVTLGALRELYILTKDKEVQKLAIKELEFNKYMQDIYNNGNGIVYHEKFSKHQNNDVAFALESIKKNGFVFFFNAPRTGKTPMTIKVMDEIKAKKVIIANLKGVLVQFTEEIKTWSSNPDKWEIVILSGKSPEERKNIWKKFNDPNKNVILISSYETLKIDKDKLNTVFDLMIMDEPHKKIKNATSDTFYAIREIASYAGARIAITGTPISNMITETYNYFSLAWPNRFKNRQMFNQRYLNENVQNFGNKSITNYDSWKRESEVMEILKGCATNRERINAKIPMEIEEVEMDQRQINTLTNIKVWGEIKLDEKAEFEVMDEVLKVKRKVKSKYYTVDSILNAGILNREIMVGVSAIKGMIEKKPSPKLYWILKFLVNNPDKKVLIFTDHSLFIEKNVHFFKKLGIKYAITTGATSAKGIAENKDNFNNGDTRVIIGNTQTLSTGGTYNKADVVIFLNLPWNPDDFGQACDRLLDRNDENNKHKRIIWLKHNHPTDIESFTKIEDKIEKQKYVNSFRSELNKMGGK